jgi:transcription regulator, gntR family
MNYTIDINLQMPAYLQLYNQIKADIVKGIYPYGSKVPSKRTMAVETGISTITVEHAYALLCEEGYIESRERSGFFVVFRLVDGFASTPQKPVPPKILPHSHHANLEFPFSILTKAMRRVMSDYGENILIKSPNSGCVELRETLRQYLARNRGIYIDTEQIIIGSGAEYLYTLIVGILGQEQIFALESPSYEKIEQVYQAAGITCDLLPLGSDGIESSALAQTKATVLHLSPYRSFPTGITASASKRYEYIRWAEQPGHFFVEDDFESEFTISTKPEETLFSLSENDNVIYLNTFSQTISPSLRMGYMVLPKRLVNIFSEKLGFYSCTVPTFEQLVLAKLISEGDFERHINRIRRAKRKNI